MAKREREARLDPHRTYLDYWESLTPSERLMRCWAMRRRIPDIRAVHDAKLFPRP